MHARSLFSLTVLIIASVSASDVVTLTVANFDEQTKATTGDNGSWLVEFYAPWCGHCKKLQPIWEELATNVKGSINVAKVDVTDNRDLGTRFGIKGFPTVKFFHEGSVYDYKGARTVAAFKEFVTDGFTKTEGKRL
mmetsp:Transcript_12450/g.18828  ORF Transcript_12450/g.18828 Transcript_12450/m.18828 type:complete len:136 (-) Transcript_12450:91-498(-)|eukprot:CAMPEP_0185019414 /NCGR_PEP_ID=MMETSP1103-20130426/2038_1 /TAXON_ID=36769 /ORGANISM="Paraphysomonas bandaiensis, Strain Caron Lab Isolate" /LENGTH=135 /DNA_ID=CAMNT_0027549725 /DNA_START=42 /DNA_END=449 /DNA_ORIENTATION=-